MTDQRNPFKSERREFSVGGARLSPLNGFWLPDVWATSGQLGPREDKGLEATSPPPPLRAAQLPTPAPSPFLSCWQRFRTASQTQRQGRGMGQKVRPGERHDFSVSFCFPFISPHNSFCSNLGCTYELEELLDSSSP